MSGSVESGRGRSAALDGLRGFAAAAVVIYHGILGGSPRMLDILYTGALGVPGPALGAKLALSAVSGEMAVGLFFVISGTVLFRALGRMDRGGETVFGLSWRFLLRRVVRLWPVMAVCLGVHLLVLQGANAIRPGFTEAHSWGELAGNLVFLNTSVIGATWTLAVEMAAAPWLLLSYLCVRRIGVWWSLPVFAAGLVGMHRLGLLVHPPGFLTGWLMMLAGGLSESLAEAGWRLRGAWRVALPVGVVLALGNQVFVSWFAKAHALLLVGSSALIVGAVAAAAWPAVNRVLEGRVAQFLGRISYSLYLWNVMFLLLGLGLAGHERTAAQPVLWGLVVGFGALGAAIPVSVLSERWIEVPSIQLGRALTRRRPKLVLSEVG